MAELGVIISTQDGPSTKKFSFVLNRNAKVKKGQLLQVDCDKKIIARVTDIRGSNRYFFDPESVTGAEIDRYPTWEWEYRVADALILGSYDGSASTCYSPPSPGMIVKDPDKDILVDFFGLNQDGLNLGSFAHYDLEARFDMTKLLHKHLAILAMSGAGKSYLVSVLLEEILERKAEKGTLAIVVIDPHGEYASFANDHKYSHRVKIFQEKDIKISFERILKSKKAGMFGLTHAQLRDMVRMKCKSIEEMLERLEESKIKSQKKESILSALHQMLEMKLIYEKDGPAPEKIAQLGTLSVIDLSDITSMDKKQLIVWHIAKMLFDARREERIPPFLLVVEEAHQFIPEKAKKDETPARSILQTIAREGRKFHACLCLISQRPKHLSTTVLSQCNTNIILRVTNPYDLDHIGASSEGISREVLDQISTLPVGHALVVGEAVKFPLFIKVRKRKSKECEKGKPLEQAAKEYYQNLNRLSADARSFM